MSSMMVTMHMSSRHLAIHYGGIGVILGISHGVRLGIIMAGIGIILIWGFRIGITLIGIIHIGIMEVITIIIIHTTGG